MSRGLPCLLSSVSCAKDALQSTSKLTKHDRGPWGGRVNDELTRPRGATMARAECLRDISSQQKKDGGRLERDAASLEPHAS